MDYIQKEKRHLEDLERLRALRPIDDTFMRGLFKENIPLVELVLRIITNKPDLKILKCETQADMKRVTGARSICLDVYATDSTGKKYDIEVQRADEGADPHRARYHSSMMDVENLDSNDDYTKLPDTYVIFITENDYYQAGRPVYMIQNINVTLNQPFTDGTHIIYVNGSYRDESDIGKLMHDFNCTKAEEMYFPLMAEKTSYLKENPKGVSQMCKVMEDLRNESYNEGRAEGRAEGRTEGRTEGRELQAKETAINLSKLGLSPEVIAKSINFNLSIVKKWIASSAI